MEHHFIFWSLYFILTVNFMVIESTNKVSPSYYVSQTFSYSYINTVNTLKTYNQQEIKFSDREITILTNPIQTYNDIKRRAKIFDKFYKKIEDIKCTCSFIVKTKLVYLTNILEGLRKGGPTIVSREKLNVLKEEAGFMVLLFQEGNVKAGKWFWSYYFKIMAIIDYESNKFFLEETPFEEEELQNGIKNCIKYCKNNKYLPKNQTESNFLSKNGNVPYYIFQNLRASLSLSVNYLYVMQYVSIDQLYLKPLWAEHELLFGEITGSDVEWRLTIRRHAVEVSKTKEYIESRQWISKPFGHLSYHRLIKQIISVRMYTFLWVMLVIYSKMNPFQLTLFYWKAMDIIDTVQRFMPYTEHLFSDVVAEIRCLMHDNQNNFDSIIARISVRVKDILVELNGCHSNRSDLIRIDINEEFSVDVLMTFLQEFGENFNKLTILNCELALSILIEGN